MRKLLIPITMMMLAALVLSACTGSAAPATSTSTATTGTGAATGTATTGAVTSTSTAAAGTGTPGTGTGTAVVPSTGGATGTSPASAGTGTASPNQTTTTGAGTAYPAGTPTTSSLINSTASSADTAATLDAQSATQTAAAGGVATMAPTGTTAAANNTPSAANAGATAAPATAGATANAQASTATATNGGVATTVPTVSATGTAAAGTSGTTGSTGSTGATGGTTAFAQGQLVKLSDILKSSVTGSDQVQLGRVDGLLIERPVLPGEGQPTPAAGEATATPVPTLSAPPQVFVRYILVNVTSGATGATGQAGNTASPQGGSQVVIPWQAVTGSSGAATGSTGTPTLRVSVTTNDLASAPHTSLLDVVSGSNAWMTPLASYWGGKGVSIPNTGASTGSTNAQPTSRMLFIPRERGGINITDIKGTTLGQDTDLLIDAKTGEVMYVVFDAGPAFNNQVVAVPMRAMTWTLGQGAAEITNRGALALNFNTDVLKNFPNLGDLSNLTTDPNVLNALNTFWNSIQNSGASK